MADKKEETKKPIIIGGHRKSAKDQLADLLKEFDEKQPDLRTEIKSSPEILDSISSALQEIEEFKKTMPEQELQADIAASEQSKLNKENKKITDGMQAPKNSPEGPEVLKERLKNLDNLFGQNNENKDAVMQKYIAEVVAPGKGVEYSELDKESKEYVDKLLNKEVQDYKAELTKDIAELEKKTFKGKLSNIKESLASYVSTSKSTSPPPKERQSGRNSGVPEM